MNLQNPPKDKCHSNNWLGGKGKFVVDGIDLSGFDNENDTINKLIEKENGFIERIKGIINCPLEEFI